MTTDERIEAAATEAVGACYGRLGPEDHKAVVTVLRRLVDEAVREEREADCRAVCPDCAADVLVMDDPYAGVVHAEGPQYRLRQCRAAAIRQREGK